MTIILGFVLPIVMFLVMIPIKAAIKAWGEVLAGGKPAKASLMDKLNNKLDKEDKSDTKSDKRKVVKISSDVVKSLSKMSIRALKTIINVIKAVVFVIQTLVALGAVGLVIAVVVLIAGAAGAILLVYTASNGLSSDVNLSGGSTISDTSISTVQGYDKWFWVGDSRTVGLAVTKGASFTSGSDTVINDTYCAKVGMGLDWFTGDEVKDKREEIYALTETNVVFNLGVNDMDNIDKYISFYDSLPEDFIKNNTVIVMSVNPINDTLAAGNYAVKNASVIEFNDKLKSSLPSGITWVDTYTEVFKNIDSATTDGVHYTSDTYNKIYDIVVNSVSSGGTTEETEESTESTTNN